MTKEQKVFKKTLKQIKKANKYFAVDMWFTKEFYNRIKKDI